MLALLGQQMGVVAKAFLKSAPWSAISRRAVSSGVVPPIVTSWLVLQKVPSEANPKVRNHGEGPYKSLLLVESGYYRFHI